MKELTEKQEAIYIFVKDFIALNNYSPSFREIADKFSMTSKGISDHLKCIKKKGYIDYSPKLARTIVIK
ncbi:MAG TPA: ArsR family transcriptional regulator [Spirochaetota bacterium]|nr:ArsR family transcriptional regulator [Spirochaetota bacterium]